MDRKRKVLSVEDKIKIINAIEEGKRKSEVSREFELPNSTIHTIWNSRVKLKESFNNNCTKMKRLRKPEHTEVDEALLQWYREQKSLNIPVTGPLLTAKARDFAKLFGNDKFVCSTGWIDRFKVRHNILLGRQQEEARVDDTSVHEWLGTVWPQVREGYTDNDIFNSNRVGDPRSKDGVTLLVCGNMDATVKKKLVVTPNKKLFQDELCEWNTELFKMKKKILLLLDNCTDYKIDERKITNIKLVFLPPSLTIFLQSMDQALKRSVNLLQPANENEKNDSTSDVLADNEIVNKVKKQDVGDELNVPSIDEAIEATKTLIRFYTCTDSNENIVTQIINIQKDLQDRFATVLNSHDARISSFIYKQK